MKKMLLEYASLIAYAITGLVFGLSFFLLFINFYHMQEINYSYDVASYVADNKQVAMEKINIIKNNIAVYNSVNYNGTLNIYGLNSVKLKLESCVEILESDDIMKYFDKNYIQLKDSYNLAIDFNDKIINDCIVMQLKSAFNEDTVSKLPNAEFMKSYVDIYLNNSITNINYIVSNLENADHYYYTTENNKSNFFDLTKDSYTSVLVDYQNFLDFLVDISEWYKSIVIGG